MRLPGLLGARSRARTVSADAFRAAVQPRDANDHVVVVRLLVRGVDGGGAYGPGQYAAGVIALVMVVLGVRAVLNSRAW